MRLPNVQKALVEEKKISGYLLNAAQPDGTGKARFFRSLGFTTENWKQFADALIKHAIQNHIAEVVESSYGRRYTVVGELMTPSGQIPIVQTVWIVEKGRPHPRLITAYPAKRIR